MTTQINNPVQGNVWKQSLVWEINVAYISIKVQAQGRYTSTLLYNCHINHVYLDYMYNCIK